mmetsp:Transcript_41322/g.137417  ORF Transcript_41322/g.137417 Transcript_41322/m.137417 type:complete len:293 (+) Transcript_41322:302-1180(+)
MARDRLRWLEIAVLHPTVEAACERLVERAEVDTVTFLELLAAQPVQRRANQLEVHRGATGCRRRRRCLGGGVHPFRCRPAGAEEAAAAANAPTLPLLDLALADTRTLGGARSPACRCVREGESHLAAVSGTQQLEAAVRPHRITRRAQGQRDRSRLAVRLALCVSLPPSARHAAVRRRRTALCAASHLLEGEAEPLLVRLPRTAAAEEDQRHGRPRRPRPRVGELRPLPPRHVQQLPPAAALLEPDHALGANHLAQRRVPLRASQPVLRPRKQVLRARRRGWVRVRVRIWLG